MEQRRARLAAAILAPFPKLRAAGSGTATGVTERHGTLFVSDTARMQANVPLRIGQIVAPAKLPPLVACPDPARASPRAAQRKTRRDAASHAVRLRGDRLGVAAYEIPVALKSFLLRDARRKAVRRGFAWELAHCAVEYAFGAPLPLMEAHALVMDWAGRERGWQLDFVDGTRLESRFNDPRGVRYLALPKEVGMLERMPGPPLRRGPAMPDGTEPPASMLMASLGGGDGEGWSNPTTKTSGGWWYEAPSSEAAGLTRGAAGRRGVGLGRAGRLSAHETAERTRAASSRRAEEDAVTHLAMGLRNDHPRGPPPQRVPLPFEGMGTALVPQATRALGAEGRTQWRSIGTETTLGTTHVVADAPWRSAQVNVLHSEGAGGRGGLVASAELLLARRSRQFPDPSHIAIREDAPWWSGQDVADFERERLTATVRRNPAAALPTIDASRIQAAAEEIVRRETEAKAHQPTVRRPRLGGARNLERRRLRGDVAALLGVDLDALHLGTAVDNAVAKEMRRAESIARQVEALGLRS